MIHILIPTSLAFSFIGIFWWLMQLIHTKFTDGFAECMAFCVLCAAVGFGISAVHAVNP